AEAAGRARESVAFGQQSLDANLANLPAFMLGWNSPRWTDAGSSPDRAMDAPVLAGWLAPLADDRLGVNRDFATDLSIPLFVDTTSHLRVRFQELARREANELVHALALRRLAAA